MATVEEDRLRLQLKAATERSVRWGEGGVLNNTCEHVNRWGPITATNSTQTKTHNNAKTSSLHNSSWYGVYSMDQFVQTKHNQLLRNRYTRNNWVHQ